MDKEKLGQDAAFPMDFEQRNDYQLGMSKRFYAACAILSGIVANANPNVLKMDKVDAISTSYSYADELLKQENE